MDEKLEKSILLYTLLKNQLEENKKGEAKISDKEELLVYYIDHLKKWIEDQNKVVFDMSEVFKGIKKFTQF